MGTGAGKPLSPSGESVAIGELNLRHGGVSCPREDSEYLAERATKRWKSKGDGVLWGKLSSLDKGEIGDIYLQGDVFSIGRDGVLCTYQIANRLVSSYHLELKVEQYGKSVRVIFVHDHSTNGTFIDGKRVGVGNKVVLRDGAKLSLPWVSNGEEKIVSFQYEPIKVVSDDWEPILEKYTFGTITFEGTFTTFQLLSPKAPADNKSENTAPTEILTAKIINMGQMQLSFSTKSAESMVTKEVTLLNRLQHRNIAPLRDSFMGKDYSFLVFKYPTLLPNKAYDLSELVQVQWDAASQMLNENETVKGKNLISEGLVRVLAKQLVEVVAYIHQEGVSHRNVSPENVLLDYGSDTGVGNNSVIVKLSNFGFASNFGDNVAMQTKIETGHIDFCAPEMIIQEHGYGKEVDLWSVGVLIMMLLGGGRAPFRREFVDETLATDSSAENTERRTSMTSLSSRDESGLSTAAVIENITQANFEFVPAAIWSATTRSESCKEFIRALLVADPEKRASAEDLLNGKHSNWINET